MTSHNDKLRIGIFVATQFELATLLNLFTDFKILQKTKPLVACASKNNCLVFFIKVGPGVSVSNKKIEKLILRHRFDLAVVVGFAGGLKSEHKVGDLVLSYFQGLKDPSKKEFRNRAAAVLFKLAQKNSTVCLTGRTVSSATFLETPAQKKEFQKLNPDSIAVDMENEKLGELFSQHQIPALSLRAISDSFKQNFDWKTWDELHRLTKKNKGVLAKFILRHPLKAAYYLCVDRRLHYARKKYTGLVLAFLNGLATLSAAERDNVVANIIKGHL